MAFETAKKHRQYIQAGSGVSLKRDKCEGKSKAARTLIDYARTIEQDMEVLKLGLDYARWLGYRRELGNVDPTISLYDDDKEADLDEGPIKLFSEYDDKSVEKWVRRNLPFSTDSILWWQDSMQNTDGLSAMIAERLNSPPGN